METPEEKQEKAVGTPEEGTSTPSKETQPIPEEKKPKDESKVSEEQEKDYKKVPIKEYKKLVMASNRARNLAKQVKRNKDANNVDNAVNFDLEVPAETDDTELELSNQQREEYNKFKDSLSNTLIENADYQELLKKNPVLKRVLRTDPLSLLTSEERSELHFAEDALEKLTNFFDELIESSKTNSKGVPKPEGKEFSTGPANPQGTELPKKDSSEEQYAHGKKQGGLGGAEQMIRSKLKTK